jgi:hypothetical protein
MREKLGCLAQACSNWSLVALLFILPSGRHWDVYHPQVQVAHLAYYEPVLYATDLLLCASIGCWLLARFLSRDRSRLQWGPVFFAVPLLGFLLLAILSVSRAVDPGYAAFPIARLVLMLIFYLMLVNAPLRRDQIAWSLGAAMVVQAALSVPQFLLGHTAGLHQLGEIPNDSRWPGASVVAVGERRWLRAYGLTQHPNVLGGLAMTSLLIVAGFYLRQAGLRWFVLLGLLATSLGTLLLTFSRSAWVGTAVGVIALLGLLVWVQRVRTDTVRKPAAWWLAAMVLAVGLTFASLVWPLLVPRLGLASEGVEIRSVEERLILSDAALGLIQMRPWFGVGLGGFSAALYRLTPEAVSYYAEFMPVHNIVFLVTAELGLLGGLLWLCLVVSPWLALWLQRRQVRMTLWWAGLCGGMAALTVAGLFDHYPWSFQQGRLIFWLVWGLWAREYAESRRR